VWQDSRHLPLLLVAVGDDNFNDIGGQPGRLRKFEKIRGDLSGLDATLTVDYGQAGVDPLACCSTSIRGISRSRTPPKQGNEGGGEGVGRGKGGVPFQPFHPLWVMRSTMWR
jgi:hypothetical protein